KRYAISAQLVGVQLYLVLAHKPADRGHFGHAGDGFELITQEPVLQASKLRQAVLMSVIDDEVFVDPAGAGRVGTDHRVNAFRQAAADLLHVFEDPRARPVEVRSVLKYDENIRVPEHRLRSDGFDVGRGQQRRD